MKIKVLNLYAGIGGNRKLWTDVDVTAVEIEPSIAKIYQHFFPNDNVVIEDAHQYLLKHFKEFDFIWTSPPCPTHSKINKCYTVGKATNPPTFPDMKLYEEVLLLQGCFEGKYAVENVISWYEPLIKPQEVGMHYFWANFRISQFDVKSREHYSGIEVLQKTKGFNIGKFKVANKIQTLRNCVEPELGLHIFNSAYRKVDFGGYFK